MNIDHKQDEFSGVQHICANPGLTDNKTYQNTNTTECVHTLTKNNNETQNTKVQFTFMKFSEFTKMLPTENKPNWDVSNTQDCLFFFGRTQLRVVAYIVHGETFDIYMIYGGENSKIPPFTADDIKKYSNELRDQIKQSKTGVEQKKEEKPDAEKTVEEKPAVTTDATGTEGATLEKQEEKPHAENTELQNSKVEVAKQEEQPDAEKTVEEKPTDEKLIEVGKKGEEPDGEKSEEFHSINSDHEQSEQAVNPVNDPTKPNTNPPTEQKQTVGDSTDNTTGSVPVVEATNPMIEPKKPTQLVGDSTCDTTGPNGNPASGSGQTGSGISQPSAMEQVIKYVLVVVLCVFILLYGVYVFYPELFHEYLVDSNTNTFIVKKESESAVKSQSDHLVQSVVVQPGSNNIDKQSASVETIHESIQNEVKLDVQNNDNLNVENNEKKPLENVQKTENDKSDQTKGSDGVDSNKADKDSNKDEQSSWFSGIFG
jgi:hypothetical protein